jgi:glutaminyl-tRNA synthetase
MSRCRNEKIDSPYRNTSVEENLKLFYKMKNGFFAEGECSLRAKMDMKHDNPTMRDVVCYRIRYVPHPHSGDAWCIYPTYDYTHCIVDSLENITHSLCTLEFEIRREPYYWFLKELDLYKPFVWEYSRLNISNTVLSKRKIEKLIADKHVIGWNDPRLHTVQGLRRRGYTPSVINAFCEAIGVSRKGNENITSYKKLEFYARKELDATAPRTFAVRVPVLLEIVNFEKVTNTKITAPLFPADPSKGTQTYTVTK